MAWQWTQTPPGVCTLQRGREHPAHMVTAEAYFFPRTRARVGDGFLIVTATSMTLPSILTIGTFSTPPDLSLRHGDPPIAASTGHAFQVLTSSGDTECFPIRLTETKFTFRRSGE